MKLCWSRLHSTREVSSATPPLWRRRVARKAGCPGAPAPNEVEEAGATPQRVLAAVEPEQGTARTRITATPLALAASARRRVAVKSAARLSPCNSTTTAPRPGQRAASSAAWSTSPARPKVVTNTSSGEAPKARRPEPSRRPESASRRSWRTQAMNPVLAAMSASPNPKPAAAAKDPERSPRKPSSGKQLGMTSHTVPMRASPRRNTVAQCSTRIDEGAWQPLNRTRRG